MRTASTEVLGCPTTVHTPRVGRSGRHVDLEKPTWTGVAELTDAIHRLAAAPPDVIVVDLAAVTFVGSILPNFLARLRQAVPATTEVTVSHPTRSARFILRVTDAAQFAKTADALPG